MSWRNRGVLFVVGGVLLISLGLAVGSHRPNYVFLISGAAVASAGLLRLRRRPAGAQSSVASLGIVGFAVSAVGVCFTVLPLIVLALHHYALAAITSAGVVIGPYLAFLGYVTVWRALSDSTPPMARRFGLATGWAWSRLNRSL
jgi:hypothetical protein